VPHLKPPQIILALLFLIPLAIFGLTSAQGFTLQEFRAALEKARTERAAAEAKADQEFLTAVNQASSAKATALKQAQTQLDQGQITDNEYEAIEASINANYDRLISQAETARSTKVQQAASVITPWKYLGSGGTGTAPSSPEASSTTPIVLLPSSAGPLVAPVCYPPEPGYPSLPPAAPSRFSNCKDIVISPYGPFLLPIPNIQSTQPCPPGTMTNYGQCGSSGVALQLFLYPLTTDADHVFKSKNLDNLATPSWSSSDPSVAAVERGGIRPLKPGKATITVTDPNTPDSCGSANVDVTVVMPLKNQQPKLVLNPSAISLAAGDIQKLTAHYTMDIVDYYDMSTTRVQDKDVNTSVKWATTDPTVVIVDAQGNITEQGVGTAKITALYCGQSAESRITVTSSAQAPVSIPSLDQVCADKSDIPNREKALGVIDAKLVTWGRGRGLYGLGLANFIPEPGKYSYVKFDYNPWNAKLTDLWLDASASQWQMQCGWAYGDTSQFENNWKQYCEIGEDNKPHVRKDLTSAQRVSCAWIEACKICAKTPQEQISEKKAECEKRKNDPNDYLNPAFYQNIKNKWNTWASKGLTNPGLGFLVGAIDTVNAASVSLGNNQMWLAYECLPSPAELKNAPAFSGFDFDKMAGSNTYFVQTFKEQSGVSDSERTNLDIFNNNPIVNAKPGRYYLIIRSDAANTGGRPTAILSSPSYFGDWNK